MLEEVSLQSKYRIDLFFSPHPHPQSINVIILQIFSNMAQLLHLVVGNISPLYLSLKSNIAAAHIMNGLIGILEISKCFHPLVNGVCVCVLFLKLTFEAEAETKNLFKSRICKCEYFSLSWHSYLHCFELTKIPGFRVDLLSEMWAAFAEGWSLETSWRCSAHLCG